MRLSKSEVVAAVVFAVALFSAGAEAHWCDDLWSSGYDIVVKPDSDTSPKSLFVENRWGYQLINFTLTAKTSSGGTVTLAPPTTLKVANTLLPGEKGIWKITAGAPAKIEDLTFYVTFGNTSGINSKQYGCYPVLGASPVMVVKNDGSLFPDKITGIDNPKPNTTNGCSLGDVGLGTSLQAQTIADWEDENVGLDKLFMTYCSGRGSWGTAGPVGSTSGEGVSPAYCKDSASTVCPSTKITVSPGSRSDYMHLWAAGALAIRKSSLGTRLATLRQRLKCGANDGDPGIAGYTLFVLGYVGDDADVRSFLQTQAAASGDIGAIAKAALYLAGDTTQKAAVQAGLQSSSVWVKVACAGALGIVDKDDAAVTSAIIPEVKWIEPDTMGGTTDNGKGMYSAHILELVAFDRRGWVFRGNADGPVTFYGESGAGNGGTTGAGGKTGAGGTTGAAGAGGTTGTSLGSGGGGSSGGSGGRSGGGGVVGGGGGGSGGGSASGGAPAGGSTGNGGQGAGGQSQGSSGGTGSGGTVAVSSGGSIAGGAVGSGGAGVGSGGQGGAATGSADTDAGGCKCSLGTRPAGSAVFLPALLGLALVLVRRRHRR